MFLNIKHPHIFDAKGREYKNINDGNFITFDSFLNLHPEYENEEWYWDYQVGDEFVKIPDNVLNDYYKLSTSKTVRTYVMENIGNRNDGVIVENVLDPADGRTKDAVPITDYVPNTSNQVKSIDNQGTFSTTDNNINRNRQEQKAPPSDLGLK